MALPMMSLIPLLLRQARELLLAPPALRGLTMVRYLLLRLKT